jgi:hypothetical protein
METATYRIIPHRHDPACDVEMTAPGAKPRVVNTFNDEADAWEWLNEQNHVADFAARFPVDRQDKHR